jgi:ketosteroid isomerase-like protein
VLKRSAKWIAFGTWLLVGLAVGAQQAKWAAPSDETARSLINMERQWAQADCDGNLAIETILADDFQGTAPDGSRYTKAQEIQDTKTSKHEDHGCQIGEVRVHFFGDSLAVLYGTESRLSQQRDGVERQRTLIWTDTWLKRGGRWQIIAAQDTDLAPDRSTH